MGPADYKDQPCPQIRIESRYIDKDPLMSLLKSLNPETKDQIKAQVNGFVAFFEFWTNV